MHIQIVKKVSFVLIIILLTEMFFPVCAAEPDKSYLHGYFHQYEDAHGRIFREYRNSEKESTREHIYSILTELGMSKAFIDKLSEDKIAMYSQAKSITSVTSYVCKDAEGNVEIVDENTAIGGAIATLMLDPPAMEDLEGDYIPTLPTYSNSKSKTYIKVTFVVTYKGDAVYHFSVDAEWLTTPDNNERYYDAIGISAHHITLRNDTRTGWYSYTETRPLLYEYEDGHTTEHTLTLLADDDYDGDYDYIRNYVNGIWLGSAAVFPLPQDSYQVGFSSDRIKLYSNFKAHYEFEGVISEPDGRTNFAAVASYDHCTMQLSVEPSLSFDPDSSFALTFSLEENHDPCIVELPEEIVYEP